jgi:RNA polymerase sigma factor (sigma-70 family)
MKPAPRATFDRADIERLYARLEVPLYNVAYRWLWNRDDARDAVQDAFVRLWRMRDRIDPATVEPLVYRIALNLAANRRRAKRLWHWVSLEPLRDRAETGLRPDDALAARDRTLALRKAIEALPERLRRVIALCEFSGMSYEEVGKALGIPAGTVASRRSLAVRRLEVLLEAGT